VHLRALAEKLVLVFAIVACVPGLWAQGVLTWHNDLARSGQNPYETLLTTSNVSSSSFGKLGTLTLDGAVDAQPLYVPGRFIGGNVHNVLYVVTENDSLYAFDADTLGSPLWTPFSALQSGESASNSDSGCHQLGPGTDTVGITSTPVIDLSYGPNGTIFFVAMTQNGSNYYDRLHAVDLVTGLEQPNWPITISATYPGSGPNSSGGNVTFVPRQYKERAALLLSNGILYTTWASNCDAGSYNGWIIAYNESTQAKTVLNLTPNGEDGAIWMAGAGPAADAGGNLYFLMANGYFDGMLNANGFPADGDYGNAFMNLSTISGLAVADYFTSDNSPVESGGQNDDDLGSGGAILLPTLNDAMGNPHALAVGAGKDGIAYVVDRNNMGKYKMSSNAVYQQFALAGSVFSSPAWFNNTLYYSANGQSINAYPYSDGSFGASSHQTSVSGFNGSTPSISSNGTANGIVWAVKNGSPSVLYAFNASTLAELYDTTQASGSRDSFGTVGHFPTPTVFGGKVYVGTSTGVAVFGLLNCTYTVNAASMTSLSVTTSSGCSWSVANGSNFIDVTGGTSGAGDGTVTFTVPPNPAVSSVGILYVAGQVIGIQDTTNTGTNGLGFYPLTPCRVVDTRANSGFTGAFGAPSLVASATRSFPVPASFCGAPPSSQAYSMNMTVVVPSGGGLGYLSSWPAGQTLPVVATLNALNGGVIGNAAIVPAGVDSAISVFANDPTDLVVDMNGYFASPSSSQALAFYPVTPCRIADTRSTSGFSGPFGPPSLVGGAEGRPFPMQGSCGIPTTALAYSVRFTVVPPGSLSYLTAYPTGDPLPVAATLNDREGGVLGNQAIVPAGTGTDGPVSVYVTNNTDLVIDINGYFAPPGPEALYFYPLTPCRVADTRAGSGFTGAFGQPSLMGGTSREFPMLSSSCNIPSSAQAYSLNMTVVVPDGEGLGYLTAYPTGQSVPVAATLNALYGGVVGAAAIVPANSSTGDISVFASNPTDLVIDINGYFAP
jgi:hypothetical protein